MALTTVQALSSALRGHRLAQGLTQGEIAASAGVSRKFVSDVESGKDTVEVGKLLALIGALGLTLDLTPIGAGSHHGEGSDFATDTRSAGAPAPDLDAHLRGYLDDEGAE